MSNRIVSYFKEFRKLPVSVKLAVIYLSIILFFSLFAGALANDVPLFVWQKGNFTLPILNRTAYLSKNNDQFTGSVFTINTPISFYYSSQDQKAGVVKPFSKGFINGTTQTHWLGTDTYNRDVLAGLIHGSKIAIWVGLIASLLSALIGLLLGSMAGYNHNSPLIMNKYSLIATGILLFIFWYLFIWNPYLFYQGNWFLRFILLYSLLRLFIFGIKISMRTAKPGKNAINFPVDTIIMKTMEIFQSVPGLFLLICLITVFGSTSIIKLSLLIALLRWTSFTRLVRGETIKIKNSEYILSARALGIPDRLIIYNHIWPNLFRQLLIAFSYGVGTAVLLEASLSFLGLGLPPDMVSWGSLLSQSRLQIDVWWLAVFPGLMISLLIASCYRVGSYLIEK